MPDRSLSVGMETINLTAGVGTLLIEKVVDVALSTDIECDGAGSASILVGLNQHFTRGMVYTLDPNANLFSVTEIQSGDVFRRIELNVAEKRNLVSLVLCDLHAEMYFNDQFIGSTVFRKLYSLNLPRYLGLAANGNASFSNLQIKDLHGNHNKQDVRTSGLVQFTIM